MLQLHLIDSLLRISLLCGALFRHEVAGVRSVEQGSPGLKGTGGLHHFSGGPFAAREILGPVSRAPNQPPHASTSGCKDQHGHHTVSERLDAAGPGQQTCAMLEPKAPPSAVAVGSIWLALGNLGFQPTKLFVADASLPLAPNGLLLGILVRCTRVYCSRGSFPGCGIWARPWHSIGESKARVLVIRKPTQIRTHPDPPLSLDRTLRPCVRL